MQSSIELITICLVFLVCQNLSFKLFAPEKEIKRAGRHPLWKSVRDAHIIRNPVCAVCGKTENLTAHHKFPVSIFPEKELDPRYLVTLCQNRSLNCHFVVGHLMDWNSYNPNIDQDIIYWREKLRNRVYKKLPAKFFWW